MTWPRGGPGGSPARPLDCPCRRRRSWTPRSHPSRTGSVPPRSTASSPTRSAGSCPPKPKNSAVEQPTAGTSRSSTPRSPSPAPPGSTGSSTSPTPWTWRPGSPTKPPSWPPAGPRSRWTCGGPRRSARSPASRPASTSPTARRRRRPGTGLPVPARQTIVHVHLSPEGPFARVEASGRRIVSVDQVREWLHTPLTEVIIKPVIDLADHLHVAQYEVPDRLADQTAERDLTCVFPWCTRPAIHCDDDHVIPYSEGGPTASDNLAPLCRRHHRLKTHSPWSYTVLEPGSYLWSSPHGYQYLRDRPRHHRRLPRNRPTRHLNPPPRRPPDQPPDGSEACAHAAGRARCRP